MSTSGKPSDRPLNDPREDTHDDPQTRLAPEPEEPLEGEDDGEQP
jgi:hypothetical protein